MSRARPAARPPAADLDVTAFPDSRLQAGTNRWWRAHLRARGPWWFSSGVEGRFDLPLPEGTCYLAGTPAAAVRERVGPELAAAGRVPMSLLTNCLVTQLPLPHAVRAGNLDAARAAAWGVTREVSDGADYSCSRSWAKRLRETGRDAVVYGLRFSPGSARGLALFGAAGEWGWGGGVRREALDVTRAARLEVVDAPGVDEITLCD